MQWRHREKKYIQQFAFNNGLNSDDNIWPFCRENLFIVAGRVSALKNNFGLLYNYTNLDSFSASLAFMIRYYFISYTVPARLMTAEISKQWNSRFISLQDMIMFCRRYEEESWPPTEPPPSLHLSTNHLSLTMMFAFHPYLTRNILLRVFYILISNQEVFVPGAFYP